MTLSPSVHRVAASPLEKRRFAAGNQSTRVDELPKGKAMKKILRQA